MKKLSTPKQNSGQKIFSKQTKLLISATRIVLIVLFVTVILTGTQAQTIKSLESQMAVLDQASASNLQNLITDLQPSVYLVKGQQQIYGVEAPKVAFCDAASVNMLYVNDPAFNQVELIKLVVYSSGELPAAIDLTQMQGFTNLRFLLIVFAYDACGGQTDECLEAKLDGMVQGTGSSIITLYQLSIPE